MSDKILVIDDDLDLCKLLKKYLELEGYSVTLRHDGVAGLQAALSQHYQLIILDIMLPGSTGFDVLADIRKNHIVPVIMLSAKDSEGDKVSGLRMGADDYITKPFNISEFIARVQSIIRRYTLYNAEQGAKQVLTRGKLNIDVTKRAVRYAEQKIELTTKEFDLLYFLAQNAGRVYTKKQIYRAVWHDEYAFDDNNIMVHIRRLRKKIEPNPENPQLILTIRGIGYKFGDEQKC